MSVFQHTVTKVNDAHFVRETPVDVSLYISLVSFKVFLLHIHIFVMLSTVRRVIFSSPLNSVLIIISYNKIINEKHFTCNDIFMTNVRRDDRSTVN